MEMPFGGTTADTFETGTRAAAWGGTTTIIDFAIQAPGKLGARVPGPLAREGRGQLRDRLRVPHDPRRRRRRRRSRRWSRCIGEGVTSFKLFMAYPGVFYSDDGQILRAMQQGGGQRRGDHDARGERDRDRRARGAGAGGGARPRPLYHGLTRPAGTGSGGHPPGHHAGRGDRRRRSTSCTCPPPRRWRRSARPGTPGRTCSPRPARSTCTCPWTTWRGRTSRAPSTWRSTPLRPREHQGSLWRGLRTDDLSVVSTDHCPFCIQGPEGTRAAATSPRSRTG